MALMAMLRPAPVPAGLRTVLALTAGLRGNPFEGPRTREYPNPPKPPTYASALFREAATRLGYRPYPTPTAAMAGFYTNPYRQTLAPCASGNVIALAARGAPVDLDARDLAERAAALRVASELNLVPTVERLARRQKACEAPAAL